MNPTLSQAQTSLSRRLRAAGLDSPALDARLLLLAATDLDPEALIRSPERPLSSSESARLEAFAQRRLSGEPIARILGRREFWSLDFLLSPETLVPRPDTETLVEAALTLTPDRAAPLDIADLGTGTGCILIALLHELPQARGVGLDISSDALATARLNAQRHGVAERTTFLHGDWSSAFGSDLDLIVSNPPYIATADIDALAPDVKDYDPRRALDGGPDGLAAYRALIPAAVKALRPGGALLLEVGADQAESVAQILAAAGLAPARPHHDLGGRARVAIGIA